MNAEDLGGDNSCYGEAVEHVDERFPDFNVAAPFAFVVESIDCRAVSGMRVRAQCSWKSEDQEIRQLDLTRMTMKRGECNQT